MKYLVAWKTENYAVWFLLIFQRRSKPWNMKLSLKNYGGLVFSTSIDSGLFLTLKIELRGHRVRISCPMLYRLRLAFHRYIRAAFVYSIYINDLPEIVKNCQVSKYTDDTILYCFSSSTLLTSLNAELAAASEWLNMNKVKRNAKICL